MNNIFKILLVMVMGLFVFVGCTSKNIYNVVDNPISVKKGITEEQVYKAIKTAGIGLGWQITKVESGLAQGQLNLRSHVAIVEIPYNTASYSIKYKNSTNLNYNADKNSIHRNYNGWIQNLDNAIKTQLNALAE